MMQTRKFIHLWLALLLALGPVSSALAGTFGASDKHHHGMAMQDVHDSATHGGAARADTDTGHEHGAGHNHATCGTACMAALMTDHSSPSITAATFCYSRLLIPVTGIVFPPHARPPQSS